MISREKLLYIFSDYEEILMKKILVYEVDKEFISEKVAGFKPKILITRIRCQVFAELGNSKGIKDAILSLDKEIYEFFESIKFREIVFTKSMLEVICRICTLFLELASEYQIDEKNIKSIKVLKFYSNFNYEVIVDGNNKIKIQKMLIEKLKSLQLNDRAYMNDFVYYLLQEEFYLDEKPEKLTNKTRNYNIAYLECLKKNLSELKMFIM